jgi:hypothetical protein
MATDRGGRDDSSVGTVARSARRSGGGHCLGGAAGRAARCPDSGLKARVRGAARGSHAAMARCCASPARRAASDRWGPLVSDF